MESHDDRQLATELQLAHPRAQAAVVRAIADQVELFSRAGDADGLGNQLIEEMTRLECRVLEAAGALAESSRCEESGVFRRGRSSSAAD